MGPFVVDPRVVVPPDLTPGPATPAQMFGTHVVRVTAVVPGERAGRIGRVAGAVTQGLAQVAAPRKPK